MILVNKKIGETPLDCIKKIKENKGRFARLPMTYAGRLDPMAEGLMIILVGDECKDEEKAKFIGLDKEYEFEVLFGFSTDTYDILGLVNEESTSLNEMNAMDFSEDKIIEISKTFIGKKKQKYPRYSSKTISGKPLFSLSRSGELNEEEIPEREIEIKSLDFLDYKTISSNEILKIIEEKIENVEGDFRQDDILYRWRKVLGDVSSLEKEKVRNFVLAKFKASVTSGTYIRVIANEMGNSLGGIPSLAFSIIRTRIGNFKLTDTLF